MKKFILLSLCFLTANYLSAMDAEHLSADTLANAASHLAAMQHLLKQSKHTALFDPIVKAFNEIYRALGPHESICLKAGWATLTPDQQRSLQIMLTARMSLISAYLQANREKNFYNDLKDYLPFLIDKDITQFTEMDFLCLSLLAVDLKEQEKDFVNARNAYEKLQTATQRPDRQVLALLANASIKKHEDPTSFEIQELEDRALEITKNALLNFLYQAACCTKARDINGYHVYFKQAFDLFGHFIDNNDVDNFLEEQVLAPERTTWNGISTTEGARLRLIKQLIKGFEERARSHVNQQRYKALVLAYLHDGHAQAQTNDQQISFSVLRCYADLMIAPAVEIPIILQKLQELYEQFVKQIDLAQYDNIFHLDLLAGWFHWHQGDQEFTNATPILEVLTKHFMAQRADQLNKNEQLSLLLLAHGYSMNPTSKKKARKILNYLATDKSSKDIHIASLSALALLNDDHEALRKSGIEKSADLTAQSMIQNICQGINFFQLAKTNVQFEGGASRCYQMAAYTLASFLLLSKHELRTAGSIVGHPMQDSWPTIVSHYPNNEQTVKDEIGYMLAQRLISALPKMQRNQKFNERYELLIKTLIALAHKTSSETLKWKCVVLEGDFYQCCAPLHDKKKRQTYLETSTRLYTQARNACQQRSRMLSSTQPLRNYYRLLYAESTQHALKTAQLLEDQNQMLDLYKELIDITTSQNKVSITLEYTYLLVGLGKAKEALVVLSKQYGSMTHSDPDYGFIQAAYGLTYATLTKKGGHQQLEKARTALKNALDSNRLNASMVANLQLELAELYALEKNTSEALRYFNLVLTCTENIRAVTLAHAHKALIEFKQKNISQALDHADKALANRELPADLKQKLLVQKAFAYFASNQYDLMMPCAQRVLEDETLPDNLKPQLLVCLANGHKQQGNVSLAFDCLEKATSYPGKSISHEEAHIELAIHCCTQSNWQGARQHLSRLKQTAQAYIRTQAAVLNALIDINLNQHLDSKPYFDFTIANSYEQVAYGKPVFWLFYGIHLRDQGLVDKAYDYLTRARTQQEFMQVTIAAQLACARLIAKFDRRHALELIENALQNDALTQSHKADFYALGAIILYMEEIESHVFSSLNDRVNHIKQSSAYQYARNVWIQEENQHAKNMVAPIINEAKVWQKASESTAEYDLTWTELQAYDQSDQKNIAPNEIVAHSYILGRLWHKKEQYRLLQSLDAERLKDHPEIKFKADIIDAANKIGLESDDELIKQIDFSHPEYESELPTALVPFYWYLYSRYLAKEDMADQAHGYEQKLMNQTENLAIKESLRMRYAFNAFYADRFEEGRKIIEQLAQQDENLFEKAAAQQILAFIIYDDHIRPNPHVSDEEVTAMLHQSGAALLIIEADRQPHNIKAHLQAQKLMIYLDPAHKNERIACCANQSIDQSARHWALLEQAQDLVQHDKKDAAIEKLHIIIQESKEASMQQEARELVAQLS